MTWADQVAPLWQVRQVPISSNLLKNVGMKHTWVSWEIHKKLPGTKEIKLIEFDFQMFHLKSGMIPIDNGPGWLKTAVIYSHGEQFQPG